MATATKKKNAKKPTLDKKNRDWLRDDLRAVFTTCFQGIQAFGARDKHDPWTRCLEDENLQFDVLAEMACYVEKLGTLKHDVANGGQTMVAGAMDIVLTGAVNWGAGQSEKSVIAAAKSAVKGIAKEFGFDWSDLLEWRDE